jgi:SAM-dependent methyltransferase
MVPERESHSSSICIHAERDVAYSLSGLDIFQCRTCGLLRREVTEADLAPQELYSDYYLKNQLVTRFRFGIENFINAFRLFRAFKVWTIDPSAKSILDIGCGRGLTLYYLKKYFGYKRTVGTQPSLDAYLFARDTLKLEVFRDDLIELNFDKESFAVISIVHVLEHLPYPERYLLECKRLLKKDGALIIEVPNHDSWSRTLAGQYWLGYDLKNHISFFDQRSLTTLLTQAGFKINLRRTFSLEYSTFISTQGIVSRLRGTDNELFNWLQGLRDRPHVVEFILFVLIAPLAFLVNMLLYFSSRGEVLLVRAVHHD